MKKLFVLIVILSGLFFTACEKDNFKPQEDELITGYSNTDNKRTCGMDAKMKILLSDPIYKAQHERKLKMVNNIIGLREFNSDTIILPMAVHFEQVSNPDIECLRALAKSQIAVLNEDYGGTNEDISKWQNIAGNTFPGINNGKAHFKFCLATKNHPDGYGLEDGDLAVTVNKVNGDNSSDWSGYINIFVIPNTGVLGYSPLGGSGNGDGVVIDATAFGKGQGCGSISPKEPYNLGRTLTHELGHYLLLDHIWGGGCGIDDDVADTPDAEQEYYGCPEIGVSSCGSTDMFMNYMDYVNDACMYMFSEGQVTRSSNYISTSLQNIVNNAANVCGETTTEATCSDGIQNGQETGVDCGGPDCIPCENSGSSCDQTPIELEFVLDDYGSDITWELLDEEGFVLYEGGDYPDFQSGEVVQDSFCLADGCYTLIVEDLFEDGLCCEYGEGSFSLSIDGYEFVQSDGEYGANEIIEFCIEEAYDEEPARISKRVISPRVPAKIKAARIAKKR